MPEAQREPTPSRGSLTVNSTAGVWILIGLPIIMTWLGYALYSGDAYAFVQINNRGAVAETGVWVSLFNATATRVFGVGLSALGVLMALRGFSLYEPEESVAGPAPNATAAIAQVFFPMMYLLMAAGAGFWLASVSPSEYATSAGLLGFLGVTVLFLPGYLFFLYDATRPSGENDA